MPKKLTTSEFILKAKMIHGDTFEYSKVSYLNNSSNIVIICKIHGEFFQRPSNHLIGRGCPICSQERRNKNIALSTDEFIQKALKTHGNKYDYSKVRYVGCRTKVVIVCRKHGDFTQSPTNHLIGKGCSACSNENKNKESAEDFIKKALRVHEDKYDYSRVDYSDSYTKVEIRCLKHNVAFFQRPNNHIQGKTGCIECDKEKFYNSRSFSTEEFIKQAEDVHGNRYDYSLVNYVDWKSKIKIICKKHGIFEQQALNHKKGHGCPKCRAEEASLKYRLSREEFIEKAIKIHAGLYSYNNVLYTNNSIKVSITCCIHGDFKQSPGSHLRGSGCPKCKLSKGELKIKQFLDFFEIKHETGKKFEGCQYKRLLPFDFYLPELKMAIEYDGRHHFVPVNFGGKLNDVEAVKLRDTIKTEFCNSNNIKLIRISYLEFDQIETILRSIFNKGAIHETVC